MIPAVEEPLPGWCILVVDDSPDERADIRRMLLKGCDRQLTFIEAETAQAAIAAVQGARVLPDCMVLDYNLPDMDAPDVLQAITGPDGMPVCPVVVLTGGISRDDGRRVLRAGAQDYIGKEWTSPQSLSRAIENACESWAMARELRQRKEAIRLVADREAFRALFGDATRDLMDEHAVKRVASQLLGRYLGANRLVYAELKDDESVVVELGYVSGLQQIDGVYRLADYGPALLETLRSGQTSAVYDMQQEPGYSASERLAYAGLQIVSFLAVPILKNDRLVAMVCVHQQTHRVWTPDEKFMVRDIAERTWAAVEQARAEHELRRSQQELQTLADNIPDILSRFDRNLRFVFMNAAGEKATSLRKADFLGKTNRDMGIPEAICQQWETASRAVFSTGVEEVIEFEFAGPQGVRCYASRLVPEFDADGQVEFVLEVTSDVTGRKKAMDDLRLSESRFEVALKNTSILVYTTDRDLRYTWIRNPHPAFDPLAVLGHSDEELMPPQKAESLIRLKREVLESGVGKRSEFAIDIEGQQFCYDLTVEPLRHADGRIEGVTVAALEISERKQIEATLRNADRRKDEFLATLAHELRNPLAPIRTGLQLLKLAPPGEAQADMVARTLPVMERQLGQLVRLIDDLLDVSRISSGKIVLKRERISLQDMAAVALEASQPMIDAAHHTLTTDWPVQAVWLDADPTRMAQIFSNLLTNSAKYMRVGGHITFSAVLRGDSVVVSVQDTGMGIPADMLDSVFDMFTQVNRTLDRSQGGLGIGLSLVKTLVGMHDGVVEVTSGGIDQGSTFTVTLPTAASPVSGSPTILSSPARGKGPASHRIMVVDDNIDAAETLVMLLDLSGHDARAAFGGQEALDLAMQFQPEVVFLDIGLPGMDGYEVARHLLAAPATASSTLIALTGWGTEQDIQKSKKAGFHAHMTKPVDPEAVEALLATFLPP